MNVADVRAKLDPVLAGIVAHVKGMIEDPKKFLTTVPEDPRARASLAVVGLLVLRGVLKRCRR